MDTNSIRQSAKIYQFPAGGRANSGSSRVSAKPVAAIPAARIVHGSSWYHDEAIQDAELLRKR